MKSSCIYDVVVMQDRNDSYVLGDHGFMGQELLIAHLLVRYSSSVLFIFFIFFFYSSSVEQTSLHGGWV